ncbi:MAG: hypothetical protein ACRDRW_07140 [Pseudonocardiaceae bacterium]
MVAHDRGTADDAAEHGLVQHHPEPQRVGLAVQHGLAGQAQLDEAFDLGFGELFDGPANREPGGADRPGGSAD